MSTLLIKNGTLINTDNTRKADLLIRDETITEIAPNIIASAEKTIDAQGLLLIPGGIDVHTHMNLPAASGHASDDFITGSKAALWGGTTTIIDFANQKKGGSLKQALHDWHKMTEGCFTDYRLHLSVTDLNRSSHAELLGLFNTKKINSVKIFLTYPNMRLDMAQIRELFELIHNLGGIVLVHAEDGDIIAAKTQHYLCNNNIEPRYHCLSHPVTAEVNAITQIIALAKDTKCPVYIVHVSHPKSLELIANARNSGINIFAETCPQYLLLTEDVYNNAEFIEAAKYIMSPPLRNQASVAKMWDYLLRGEIDVIATDHCPFLLKQKMLGKNDFTQIPNGVPGVEHRLELLYSEGVVKRQMSVNEFVRLTATNPARIFGLYPRKGSLQIGSDADVVVFDHNCLHTLSAKTHHMTCDYSIYENLVVQGKCRHVIQRGKLAVSNDSFMLDEGGGCWLPAATIKVANRMACCK